MGSASPKTWRFDEAARHLQTALQEHPSSPMVHPHLAACYAHLGRLSEARDLIERLHAIAPVTSPRRRNRELLLSGLRLAMGEPE